MNNPLSYSSVKLDLFSKDGVYLTSASGFVVEANSKYYLITNWHVLSVKDIGASEPSEAITEPYQLKTFLHIREGHGEKSAPLPMGMWKRITVQLYDADRAPRWIEHRASKGGQFIPDVVALPIQMNLTTQMNLTLRPPGGKTPGINIDLGQWAQPADYWTKLSAIPISAIDTDVEYGPPDTVHIIGYPLDWAPEGANRTGSAFWRTSYLAAEIYEPGMRRADIFFIDPDGLEGMTGSPVVGMKNDRIKLLGVYSDRSTAKFGANAGLVYGASLVKQLISTS